MLSSSQRNNCMLIATGKLKIKDLQKPLSKEEKTRIKLLKEIISERKKDDLYDMVNSMSIDD